MAHILVVDDERDLLATLSVALKRDGHVPCCCASVKEARAAAAEERIDLVILDWMLPDGSGPEFCRWLRARSASVATPILLLTARGDEESRVAGFEAGADDYVVKPFSVRELGLRVRAHLRRGGEDEGGPHEFGELWFDTAAHESKVAGERVPLTALEFRLLHVLYDRRGRVQSREALLADVWGFSPEMATRTVDTHIKRLRQKLGVAGAYVETLRGVGYRFRERPDDPQAP